MKSVLQRVTVTDYIIFILVAIKLFATPPPHISLQKLELIEIIHGLFWGNIVH
jgi:hypothetical protein